MSPLEIPGTEMERDPLAAPPRALPASVMGAGELLDLALFDSAHQTARLCEARKSEANSPYLSNWFARRQAMLMVEWEQMKTDELRLLLHMDTDSMEIFSRSERTAGDYVHAMRQALHLDMERVTPAQIIDLLAQAQKSDRRLHDDARQWSLEQDVVKLTEELAALDPKRQPTPYTAAAILRNLLDETRFNGHGPLLAYLLAPAIVQAAFAAPRALVGIASIPKLELLRHARVGDFDLVFLRAVAEDAKRTADAQFRFAQVRAKILSMIQVERNTSMAPKAIDHFLSVPIMSVPMLAEQMDLTRKGSQLVIERLVRSGVLQVHNHENAKGRLYVCSQALGI